MKTVIVTGATSGIGYAVCGFLALRGYRVIGVGRNEERCEAARKKLSEQHNNADIFFVCADLLHQREVRRAAAEIKKILDEKCGGQLFCLINNAGGVFGLYGTTEEGYEQQFALNHLAGFLFTHELLPYIIRAKGRVIFTSSRSHKGRDMNWESVMFNKRYRPLLAYKQSKLCNMLCAFEINKRFSSDGIRAYGVDPGLVKTDIGNKSAGGIVNIVWSLRKRGGKEPEIPAKTYLMLCEARQHPEELYYKDERPASCSRHVNGDNSKRLFELSNKLCNITFGEY